MVTTLSAFVAAERVSAAASAEINCLAFISVGRGMDSEITRVLGIVWHGPFLQESVEVAWCLVAVSDAASYHVWQQSPGVYLNAFADTFHCHMAIVNDMKYEWTRRGEGGIVLAGEYLCVVMVGFCCRRQPSHKCARLQSWVGAVEQDHQPLFGEGFAFLRCGHSCLGCPSLGGDDSDRGTIGCGAPYAAYAG